MAQTQDQDFVFDFENDLQNDFTDEQSRAPPQLPAGEIGQQPRNFVKNYKKVSSCDQMFVIFCVVNIPFG
jgi:hypothetical protein